MDLQDRPASVIEQQESTAPLSPDSAPLQSRRRVPRRLLTILLLALLIPGAVISWNYLQLQSSVNHVLASDHRNAGIHVRVHYKYYLQPSVLVYDLREIAGDKSPADVFRVLLQSADALQDKRFERVELAFAGEIKFLLPGDAFRTIGGVINPGS